MATIFESNFAGQTNSLGALKPSAREVEAFGQALQQPEFRAMLCEYVQEVNDPANREQYIKEMTALEAERGNAVTFLNPQPGYVIKSRVLSTKDDSDLDSFGGVGKVFVNVCADANVDDAHPVPNAKDSQGRIAWAVPYSTSKPRRDVDKAGEQCIVFDVIFNPNVIAKTTDDFQFRQMVNNTALDGLETTFKIKLDRKRLRFPKLKFKGSSHLTVIRKPLDAADKKVEEPKIKQEVESIEPKHFIKYRYEEKDIPTLNNKAGDPCRPSAMVIEISLPEMSSAKGIDLDVLEHLLTLESKQPVAYKLVLKLPYPVFEDQGLAKFDKSLHKLMVTLPVKPAQAYKEPVDRLVSIDSGIGLEFDEAGIKNDEEETENEILMDENERHLPSYTCNIYEGLMVVTLAVRNVVADSLKKMLLENKQGYQLTFHTLGEGFVPMHYGFCLAFDNSKAQWALEDMEIEVWDNNMIVQLSMPKMGCQIYRVGCTDKELGEAINLPRLEAFKEKCFMLGKKNGAIVKAGEELDSDDSEDADCNKERHSSGESNDSACVILSESPKDGEGSKPSPSSRFLVIPSDFCKMSSNLRGILKRPRCFSESSMMQVTYAYSDHGDSSVASTITEEEEDDNEKKLKKSVRFNEVVQRQIYRSNSSILGQKHKNLKKAEQKRRKAARRASEGDMPSSTPDFKHEAEDYDQTNDSGVASSYDENGGKSEKSIVKSKKKSKKIKNADIDESADLIFNLDF